MAQYVFAEAWEQERERLTSLEEWLDPGTIRHLEVVGVQSGWRCLEVGAGAGSIARWLCARVGPAGSVLATDLDTRFLDALDEPNLHVRRHDIVADEPHGEQFDLAHARLVLEHVPERETAVARMVEALKPGGWLLIEDIDMVTHLPVTPSDAYERVAAAMTGLLASVGSDPHFGRRLAGVLYEAGLEDVQAEGRLPIGRREGNPAIEMFRLTLERVRDALIAGGIVTGSDCDEALRLLADPEFMAMPPVVIAAWGRKRAR